MDEPAAIYQFESGGLLERGGDEAIARAAPRRPIVQVLGIHGSGTSLCSHILSLLGIDMVDRIAEPGRTSPGPNNPHGGWERQEIVEFHDRILALFDREHFGLFHDLPLPVAWGADPRVVKIKQEMVAFLEKGMRGSHFGFKDPRGVRLMPIWYQILDELKLAPKIVLCVRNPAEVARSLQVRYGLDPEIGEYRWLLHMIDFFRYVGPNEFCIVEYEKWFSEPYSNIERLKKFLSLNWNQNKFDLDLALSDIIKPTLGHDKTDRRVSSQELVRSLYKLATCAGHDPSAREQIGHIAFQFVTFQQLHKPFDRSFESVVDTVAKLPGLETAVVGLRTAIGEREAAVAAAEERAGGAEARLAETAAELEGERGRLAETARERDEIAAVLARTEDEVVGLRTAIGEREAAVAAAEERAGSAEARLAETAAELEGERGRLAETARERDEIAAVLARTEDEVVGLRTAIGEREAAVAAAEGRAGGAEARLAETAAELEGERGRLAETARERDEIAAVLARTEDEVVGLRTAIGEREAAVAAAEGMAGRAEARLAETAAELEAQRVRLAETARERDETAAVLARAQDEAVGLRTAIGELETAVAAAEGMARDHATAATAMQAEIALLRSGETAAQQVARMVVAALRAEIGERGAAVAAAEGMAGRAEARLAETAAELEAQRVRLAETARERDETAAVLARAQDEAVGLRTAIGELETAVAAAEGMARDHATAATAMQAEIALLRSGETAAQQVARIMAAALRADNMPLPRTAERRSWGPAVFRLLGIRRARRAQTSFLSE